MMYIILLILFIICAGLIILSIRARANDMLVCCIKQFDCAFFKNRMYSGERTKLGYIIKDSSGNKIFLFEDDQLFKNHFRIIE